jgi:hypothetical protein
VEISADDWDFLGIRKDLGTAHALMRSPTHLQDISLYSRDARSVVDDGKQRNSSISASFQSSICVLLARSSSTCMESPRLGYCRPKRPNGLQQETGRQEFLQSEQLLRGNAGDVWLVLIPVSSCQNFDIACCPFQPVHDYNWALAWASRASTKP